MKRLVMLFMILGIHLSINNGCSNSYDCYECKKALPPKRIDDLYNPPTYDYQTVCSEEEAIQLEREGWNCKDFQNPRDEICYSCKKYDFSTYKVVFDTVCGDNLYDLKTSLGYKCTEIQP